MLVIQFSDEEFFDENTETFVYRKSERIELEHSLYALSKWEEKYEKPYLNTEMSVEELTYYINCMSWHGDISEETISRFGAKELSHIKDYIAAPHTATVINSREKGGSKKEIITSELIYYWMIAMEIPFECDKWHLNRLLMLIKVCGIKNNPKKMGKRDTMMSNSQLNKMRKASWGTRG